MVADSAGKSAILEWVAVSDKTDTDGSKRELRVYYNDDDAELGEKEAADEFQYITNFIVTKDYYASDADKKGLDRYNEIEASINPNGDNTEGVISEETAIQRAKKAESLSRFKEDSYTIVGAELVYALDIPQVEYDEDWNLISRTDTCSPYWKLIVEPMNGIDEWFPVEAEMFSEEIELEYDDAYVLIQAVEESND